MPAQETQVRSLGWEDSLEKEMATQPSILACEIPQTKEPGGLSSWGHRRVRNDLVTKQQQQGCIKAYILYSGSEDKKLLSFHLFLSHILLHKFTYILLGLEYMHAIELCLNHFLVSLKTHQNMVFNGCIVVCDDFTTLYLFFLSFKAVSQVVLVVKNPFMVPVLVSW